MIFLQSRRAHTSSCTRHADVTAHDTHDIESARRTHAIAHATPHRARMQPLAPAATSSGNGGGDGLSGGDGDGNHGHTLAHAQAAHATREQSRDARRSRHPSTSSARSPN